MIENFESRLEGVLETVPDYYQESSVYQNIISVYLKASQEVDEVRRDLILQLFVQTATWGLDYWENDYAIKPNPGDSLEVRRSRILVKMAGLTTFSKPEALRLANVYSNPKDATFNSIVNEYAFKTRHNIDNVIDYDAMIAAFEEMKPAHLEHVVGLLVRFPMVIDMTTRVKMRIVQPQSYNFNYQTPMRMKVNAMVIVPGKYNWEPPTDLALDGSFRMDGYAKMDGLAPGGKLHYIHSSDRLEIRKYVNGQLVDKEIL